MKRRWLGVLSCGVLVLASLAPSAQRRGGGRDTPPPPTPDGCACAAFGVDCLFGTATGCNVTCNGGGCVCESAWCFLGFPRSARCRCDGPQA